MAWRKWFVRGVVFTIVALAATVVVLYQRWTDPVAVRGLVLAKLRAQFIGAAVTVDSARLRLLGGIVVDEVRLGRADDPDKAEFLHIPSAVLYHDKEKMLDGDLALRKVELHRPRLRLTRDVQGRWNLQGITGPFRPDLPLPTFVIQQGVLVFEDKAPGGTGLSLELTDLNLVFLNDPVSVVSFEGSAKSSLAGLVTVQGSFQRGTGELQVAMHAKQVPLDAGWSKRITCVNLADKLQGLQLAGQAAVKANLAYYPGGQPALSYDLRLQIDQGKLRHPLLPLPLDDLHAVVHCRQGEMRLEKLQARSGKSEVAARAAAWLPCLDQTFEAHLEIKHLEVRESLFVGMPEKVRKLQPLFQPSGLATLRVAAARREGRWTTLNGGGPSTVALLGESMKVCFQKFPFPLERVTGTAELNLLNNRTEVDATAYAQERPVFIKGHWEGDTPETIDTRWDIVGADLAITEPLLEAMPAQWQQRARSFHAVGKFDVKAHIRRQPGQEVYHQEYHARFHDVAARWDFFPYPLKNVSGFLDIYPSHWELRDIQGEHAGGGQATLQGRSTMHNGKAGLVLEISGRNVPMENDLHQAVAAMPQLARAWDTLQPRGKLNFAAIIERRSPDPEDLEVQLDFRGPTMLTRFFPFPLDDVAGHVHYHRGRVEATRVQAKHGAATLSLERGVLDLYPGGAFYLDVTDLQARQLTVDADLMRAVPRSMHNTLAALKIQGPLMLRTRLVVAQKPEPGSQPDMFWDMQLWLQDASLTVGVELSKVTGMVALTGRHDGRHLQGLAGNVVLDRAECLNQPFKNVHARLDVKEDATDVLLVSFKAPCFGGDFSGQLRFMFGSNPRYELNLTASQIDLQEFGKHNLGAKNQLEGLAVGRLVLTGQGSGVASLEGHGSIDVPIGRLLNLPLLLDLLKFLGLSWPDRTAFEELHMQFALHGRRVHVRRLELLGKAVSLTGQGEFNLDGTDLQLDFYPAWARMDQLLPPSVRPFPPVLTKNLLTIEMRGKVGNQPGDVKFHKKPLPLLFDPLLQMRDRMLPPSVSAPQNQAPRTPGFNPLPARKE